MTIYLLRRLLQAIPTIFGVTFLSFFLVQAAPGDPITIMTFGQPNITPDIQENLAKSLCLDRSPWQQYVVWLFGHEDCNHAGILRGDFGHSFQSQQPVLSMIGERMWATIELTTLALILGVVIGLAVGVLSAVKQGSWFDNVARFFSVVFDALPAFWLGLMLIMLFSVTLSWLPAGGRQSLEVMTTPERILDRIEHLILPTIVLSVSWIAVMSRFMRAETLEVIRREYIRTAHAKGLSPQKVYLWHAARNALIPIVTFLGPAIVGLLSGAVVVEQIFSWPGLGRMFFNAIGRQDYPVIMAGVIFSSILVIVGNLLTDFLLVLVDPRIRLR